jgi:hypothetical protein
MVTGGNPKSKTDDVSAKLQHGEFVIPRDAMHHLAMTAPGVLSHVMQVSAAHAMAAKAKAMQSPAGPPQMAQMGGMPVVGRPAQLPPLGPQGQPGQGFKDGGLVTGSSTSAQDEADYQEAMKAMKGGTPAQGTPQQQPKQDPTDKALKDADAGKPPKRGGYFKGQQ